MVNAADAGLSRDLSWRETWQFNALSWDFPPTTTTWCRAAHQS